MNYNQNSNPYFNANSPQNPNFGFNPNHSQPYNIPTSKKSHFSGLDTLFAWLSIPVGFLFFFTLPITRNTLGGALMLWSLFVFGAVYLLCSGVKIPIASWVLGAIGMLLSVGLITGANRVLQILLMLAVLALFFSFLYTACRLHGPRITDDTCFGHLIKAIFVIPSVSIPSLFLALPIRSAGNKGKRIAKTVGWIFAGLGVAVIPTLIVVMILSYDAQFEQLLARIFSFDLKDIQSLMVDLFFGFGVTIALFGAMFGVKSRRTHSDDTAASKEVKEGTHVLPQALLCAAITPVLLVYILFFISQWDYYLSAFTGRLPETLTYAAYARNGFFELCWVSAINALLLLLFNLLIKRKEGKAPILQKIYSIVISVFTLILIATALSKLFLYIDFYGLTQKRVYAAWLILLLSVIFSLVLVKQLFPRMKLIFSILAVCVVFFAMLTLPNVEGIIAYYNVDAYLSGELAEVDVDSIRSYGVSSVPARVELRDALSEKSDRDQDEQELLLECNNALKSISRELGERPDHIFAFHFPSWRAERLIQNS